MKLSSPIYKLKRQAKLLSRDSQIRHHEALNHVAKTEGFKDWSHLAANYAKATPARAILQQTNFGDMVLIAARAGHGKTLLGLELAALAGEMSRRGFFFTLDYNDRDVWDRFGTLGIDPKASAHPVEVDTSDDICAAHIVERLSGVARGALVVVDYLQVLDQRRSTPPLEEQLWMLKKFAAENGAVIVLLSQIDRSFELMDKPIPSLDDIRLPNHVDLSIFDKRCFLHDGEIQIEVAA